MKRIALTFAMTLASASLSAQYAWQYYDGHFKSQPLIGKGIRYKVEAQGDFSHGKTPLWLNANRHGLSSLEEGNGYLRLQTMRPLSNDSARRWGVGYGVDVAVAANYTSDVVVQQAFAEARWLHGVLTVGAKEYALELKNDRLSSGSQTLGINARPVPQVRIALPEYWSIPGTGHWLHLKGHIAYGMMTDDGWQHDFTARLSRYTDHVLYHSKAGYLKIGNEYRYIPLSLELGVEFASQFGGNTHYPDGHVVKNGKGWRSFWRAFVPGGGDKPEEGTVYRNEEGNVLGSWVARGNYDTESWRLSAYADKYFEDISGMFLLDYDGYGTGDEWNERKKSDYVLYDPKDWMLGLELNLKNGSWLRDIVVEYLYTKYQSGPIYHDHTPGMKDHVGGQDNYYNHYIYPGWQHWGQAIGNPLYRSPIYNADGTIEVKDNRFMALHLGLDGQPTERLGYRVLASWQEGLGTYGRPYTKKHHNVSFMGEATYDFPKGWRVRGAYGMDFGHILGANAGVQLTVSKSGIFNL